MERLKEDRNYWIVILLGLIPFGFIYGLWFQADAIRALNTACGRKEGDDTSSRSPEFIIYLLLTWVTCGIYGLYWIYKQGKRMTAVGPAYRIADKYEDPERKGFTYIIGSLIAFVLINTVLSILFGGIISLLAGAVAGASDDGAIIAGGALSMLLTIALNIAALVFMVIGYQKFYKDLNVLCHAYNNETDGHFNKQPAGSQPAAARIAKPASGPAPALPSGTNRIPKLPSDPPARQLSQTGGVSMLSGEYAGSKIQMEPGETIVIGRDPARCALICQSEKVSRAHVSIQFVRGSYQVIDMSTNGTFSSESGRLPKNQPIEQHAGTTLRLGQSQESVRLL